MTATSGRIVQPDSTLIWRAIRGGFVAIFGIGAFVHVGLALGSPDQYRPFADAALFDWVHDGWQNIFMADPRLWALLLGGGELLVAVLLVLAPRLGYLAVVVFHLALMLFGWGFWLWCVPALAFAVPATVHAFNGVRPSRSGHPHHGLTPARRVAEVMTHLVVTVDPDDDLEVAIDLMRTTMMKSLPVVQRRKVVGMLSRSDIIHLLAGRDQRIRDDVADLLAAENQNWQVEVHDGIVTVTGLSDPHERLLAEVLAGTVRGVVAIRISQRIS